MICVRGELHAKVWDVSAADWALWSRAAVAWFLFDPVVGNALRAVGHRDRSALLESERLKRAQHWSVVLVRVAAQVVRVLSRELENCPRNPTPAHRRHTVNHVVLSLGMPCAVDLCVGFVRTWREGEDGERSILVGDEETVSARDVCLRIDPPWVAVRPLGCVPILPHERASVLIGTFDEGEV